MKDKIKNNSYLKNIDFKGFYSNNLIIKIVCLFLAIFLWSFVMENKNPVVTKDIPVIGVEYRGVDKLREDGRVIISPKAATISMRVEGRRNTITKMKNSEIKAFVDVKSIKVDSETLPIELSLPQGVNVVDQSDETLLVKTETVDTVKFPIRIMKVGDLPDNVEVDSIKLDPQEITVSGAKTYLNSIDYASVKIDQSNIDKDINLDLPINLSLKDDAAKSFLTKSSESCKVIIDVLLKKDVEIKPVVINIPDGLKVAKITFSRPTVKIKGQDDIIKLHSHITTKPIDLTNLKEGENTVDVSLDLPQSIVLAEGSNGRITATVVLEK
ncbi:YbbR-like domain-containing protein [Finegoldia magna]|uniref:CdaR family protein n=1 Tax=Finegoldia magna TaxID=1260 RepID=UPI00399BAA54